jgi:hypothetical protein
MDPNYVDPAGVAQRNATALALGNPNAQQPQTMMNTQNSAAGGQANPMQQQFSSRFQPSGATAFSSMVANNLSKYGPAGQALANMPSTFTPGQFNSVAAQNPGLAKSMLGQGGHDFAEGVKSANGWDQNRLNQFINDAADNHQQQGFTPNMMAMLNSARGGAPATTSGAGYGGDMSGGGGLAAAVGKAGMRVPGSLTPNGNRLPVGGVQPNAPGGAMAGGVTSAGPGQGSVGGPGGPPPGTMAPPPGGAPAGPAAPPDPNAGYNMGWQGGPQFHAPVPNGADPGNLASAYDAYMSGANHGNILPLFHYSAGSAALPSFNASGMLQEHRRRQGYSNTPMPYGGLPGSGTQIQPPLNGTEVVLNNSGLG